MTRTALFKSKYLRHSTTDGFDAMIHTVIQMHEDEYRKDAGTRKLTQGGQLSIISFGGGRNGNFT